MLIINAWKFKHANGTWAELGSGGSSGDVSGSGTAIDNSIATFNSSISSIQGSGVIISDSNDISGINSINIGTDIGFAPNESASGINTGGSITLGAGADAGMYVHSDNLYIENKTNDKDIIFRVCDGGTLSLIHI